MMRGRWGETVRSIQQLFSAHSSVGQSDAALLRRYVASRDEDAFSILVARHGPMVCAVCRDVLHDSHAVEDAFQATFLILVRRASSLWVDDSLGGWLYRVAYHVALRASREVTRRRTKEQGSPDLTVFPNPPDDSRHVAELHDAIARLPDTYRRALVLCDLEGIPQLEAARILQCGEATLRRRLAGARERLRSRLAARGVPPAILGRLAVVAQTELPSGWAVTTTRAALALAPVSALAARLAASAARDSLKAKGVKVLLLLTGLVSLAGATFAFTRAEDPRSSATPAPVVASNAAPPSVPKKDAAPVKEAENGPMPWIHFKSDQGYEGWVNCDAGIEFNRSGKVVRMLDVAKRAWFVYEGNDSIEKSAQHWVRDDRDQRGRLSTPMMRDAELNPKQVVPYRTPDALRRVPPILAEDYDFANLDGKKTIRLDQYDHDALGASRLHKQVWYDVATRRRIREKKLYQLGDQQQYGKEFETIDYDYPDSGPADMVALGVPRDAKVVDVTKTRAGKWDDQSPEVRAAIMALAEVVRKFPRDVRVVTNDYHGTIHLEYATVSNAYVDAYCKNMVSDVFRSSDRSRVRYFSADNQQYGDHPDDLIPSLRESPTGAFDGDRVAAWFPVDKSTNTALVTADMTYHLTRFAADDMRVHVMDSASDGFPKVVDDQWGVGHMRLMGLEALPPGEDTPQDMVVIKVNGQIQIGDRHEPFPHYYTLDPAHDWIAVRQVSWRKSYQKETWEMEDVRAKAFQQLPNGSWYVSLWEQSRTDGLEREKPSTKKPDHTRFKRVNVKALAGFDEFPKGIFNGEAFLAKARKEGAKIEPN